MRCLLFAGLFVAAAMLGAGTSLAQPYLLPFAGYTFDAGYGNGASYLARATDDLDAQGGFVVGLGLDVHVGWDRLPFVLYLRPSVAAAFVPGETVAFEGGESLDFGQRFWQADLMLIGEVPVGRSPVVPYLGAGLTYARYAADFDASGGAAVDGPASVSAWAVAPNLAAGFRFGRGSVTPLAEVRYRFAAPSPTFAERPGTTLSNGLSSVVGVRVAL